MASGPFTMDDFVEQMRQIQKLGSISGPVRWLTRRLLGSMIADDAILIRQVRIHIGIHAAMTKAEREKPEIVVSGRRRRIARGAGVTVTEVNQFFRQFETTRRMVSPPDTPSLAWKRPLALLGLVTDNPGHRDPTFVYEWPGGFDRMLLLLITVSMFAALAIIWWSTLH